MSEAAIEAPETTTEAERENSSAQDMDLETLNPTGAGNGEPEAAVNGDSNLKRGREEGTESGEENGDDTKKQKVGKSVEEQRLEKMGGDEGEKKGLEESGRVTLGQKSFWSSLEMFDYFFKLLHYWTPNVNFNKYEHMMLLELLKKGHLEPEKKIGVGISAFQVQFHPKFRSRCFFLLRDDKSVDDFSFRKCVDHILPLPENMQIKSSVNKAFGGRRGGGGGRGGRGRGRGRGWN